MEFSATPVDPEIELKLSPIVDEFLNQRMVEVLSVSYNICEFYIDLHSGILLGRSIANDCYFNIIAYK